MLMRPSRVLGKLRAGEMVSCAKMNINDPTSAEIAALCGFDCIWIDAEHIPCDWSVVRAMTQAAKLQDADAMVRVSRGCYSDYIKPLELDAAGIMVPHVMSAQDCRDVVRMTRFHPIGRRPIDGGYTDGAYAAMDLAEYVEQGNRERFVVIQIEDPEPLDELDEICATPGIDMVFFGANDFAHASGIVGQFDHPLIIETRRRIAETALKHGKYAAIPASPDNIDAMIELGYRFFVMGADVVGLRQYWQGLFEAFKKRQ